MKLRNKKTGEIIESACIGVFKHKSSGDCERVDTEARSLEKVLEAWEDYVEPSEPLIKDEKIRKAVRAWAEIFNIDELRYMELHGVSGHYLSHSFHSIDVPDIEGLKVFNYYTIAELCGE